MWRDFHVVDGRDGQGILFFPESGKLYGVPAATAARLRAYRDGTGNAPPEAAAILGAEEEKGAAALPAEDADAVTTLCLYTAHDCNLACTYCYNQRGRASAPGAMMTPETARAAIDRFFTHPDVSYAIAFYGGEPFLNPGTIKATVEYAGQLRQEKGIRIRFSATTNGTVMNRDLLDLLARHFSHVTVSLDGLPEVNDRHRRHANSERLSVHDQAVATVRTLKQHTGLTVSVKGTLTRQGLPHYAESLAHLNGLGADAAAIDPAFGPADADWALAGEDWRRHVERLAAEAAADLADPAETTRPWSEYSFQILAGLLTKRRLSRHCNAGRDLAVMADGRLYACHGLAGLPEFAMGRVDRPDDTDYRRVHDEFAELNVRTVEDCAACWARYLCGGACYANAWLRTGSLRRADPMHCQTFLPIAEAVIAAFVETAADPQRATALARKVRGLIAEAPRPHA
ncbi:MAG: SPASM domain-containing protein [Thiobacillus sp.]|nr:SPASM domain-containing protein [Thiobacillus sp.]